MPSLGRDAAGRWVRQVVVEGVPYEWGEYLLWNPYKGFRWLNEYNGHWTYIRTLIERPDVGSGEPRYLERSFQHFQSARAEVTYVVGEFFWRVSVGETALVEDYVAPPYLLSRETTDKEVVWSLGQSQSLYRTSTLEQAQLDRTGVLRKEREVDAPTVPGGSERI